MGRITRHITAGLSAIVLLAGCDPTRRLAEEQVLLKQNKVRVEGDREGVLGDVMVRVSPSYALDMHVDTDEANGLGLTNDSVVGFEGLQA